MLCANPVLRELNRFDLTLKSAKSLKIHLEMDWWISDIYCSLNPLWSGMGEVVLASTSPILHPPSPPNML